MTHPGMKAYQSIAGSSLTGREADAACFRMLIDELKAAEASSDHTVRRHALARSQRLWAMIMNANVQDSGLTPQEDRQLFVTLAHRSQLYGIRAMLDPALPLTPLIRIAENVRDGLELTGSHNMQEFGADAT
ncbi:conserved hypothetical protein [Gluconacetobacter diazotrophicus PA1 5]|nr:flagellar biosynthesis regulator FlaF [Gluconacetobacter diazotrophicus]ACI53173.1 conserved hypothetical protein [Gluconacetobacter diazotrophicus PA1 5]MBB2156076.1 hypothetical protein [Gluconacetobacter diazotrophicus]TWB10453.1 protein FlaF [Gluconacetobacter diazotrophicus]